MLGLELIPRWELRDVADSQLLALLVYTVYTSLAKLLSKW